jgi:hypothetical protein
MPAPSPRLGKPETADPPGKAVVCATLKLAGAAISTANSSGPDHLNRCERLYAEIAIAV